MNRRAALLLVVIAAGCTRTAETKTESTGPAGGPAADPWQTAAGEFRKATDLATTRRVLTQLTTDLTGQPGAIPALPPADAKALTDLLRLTPDEAKELAAGNFTGLDAAYLADAFYLRDAARSLDVQGLPQEAQALAAFRWVCRQVYVRPWLIRTERGQELGPPLPPVAVLRRGYGSGLERGYVFLALAQQLGLDAAFVGPPGQEQAPHVKLVEGKLTKGPFWGVAVKAGKEMLVFDPWRGEPLPGPGGKGVGTFAQLKATPDQVKAWREDKAAPWDVPAADVAGATLYAAVPLTAAGSRAALLDAKLVGQGLRLAADPRELVARLGGAAVWAPPQDDFAYVRVLAKYLPKAEGGLSPTEYDLPAKADREKIPAASLIVAPQGLESREAAFRLAQQPLVAYLKAFVEPVPREKIQRGQFNEVSKALVEREALFAAQDQRSRDDARHTEAVQEWVTAANTMYRKLGEARKPENRLQLPEVEAQVEQFWQAGPRGGQILVDRVTAAVGRAEAAYLLALCKHEQAERAQLRFARAAGDPAKAAEPRAAALAAWAAAKDAWNRYTPYAERQEPSHPGRGGHAKGLAARAAALAADPAADL